MNKLTIAAIILAVTALTAVIVVKRDGIYSNQIIVDSSDEWWWINEQ